MTDSVRVEAVTSDGCSLDVECPVSGVQRGISGPGSLALHKGGRWSSRASDAVSAKRAI